jgi:hypothetical protein
VTERVLTEFRAVTPPGSTLAISVSIDSATSRTRARTATNLDGMRRSSGPPPAFGSGRQVWGRPAPG